MKKKLLLIVAVILMLTLSVSIFVACNKQKGDNTVTERPFELKDYIEEILSYGNNDSTSYYALGKEKTFQFNEASDFFADVTHVSDLQIGTLFSKVVTVEEQEKTYKSIYSYAKGDYICDFAEYTDIGYRSVINLSNAEYFYTTKDGVTTFYDYMGEVLLTADSSLGKVLICSDERHSYDRNYNYTGQQFKLELDNDHYAYLQISSNNDGYIAPTYAKCNGELFTNEDDGFNGGTIGGSFERRCISGSLISDAYKDYKLYVDPYCLLDYDFWTVPITIVDGAGNSIDYNFIQCESDNKSYVKELINICGQYAYYLKYTIGDKDDPDSYTFVVKDYENDYYEGGDYYAYIADPIEEEDEFVDYYIKAEHTRLDMLTGVEEPFSGFDGYYFHDLVDDLEDVLYDNFYEPAIMYDAYTLLPYGVDDNIGYLEYALKSKYLYLQSFYGEVYAIVDGITYDDNNEIDLEKYGVCAVYDVDGNLIVDVAAKLGNIEDYVMLDKQKILINASSPIGAAIVDGNLENPKYLGIQAVKVDLDEKLIFGYKQTENSDAEYFGALDFDGKIAIPFRYDFDIIFEGDYFNNGTLTVDITDGNRYYVENGVAVLNLSELDNSDDFMVVQTANSNRFFYVTRVDKLFDAENTDSKYYQFSIYLLGEDTPYMTYNTTNSNFACVFYRVFFRRQKRPR